MISFVSLSIVEHSLVLHDMQFLHPLLQGLIKGKERIAYSINIITDTTPREQSTILLHASPPASPRHRTDALNITLKALHDIPARRILQVVRFFLVDRFFLDC